MTFLNFSVSGFLKCTFLHRDPTVLCKSVSLLQVYYVLRGGGNGYLRHKKIERCVSVTTKSREYSI